MQPDGAGLWAGDHERDPSYDWLRAFGRTCPAPFQLEIECCGARSGNPLTVAPFDVQDAHFSFDGDITDRELAEIRASGAV